MRRFILGLEIIICLFFLCHSNVGIAEERDRSVHQSAESTNPQRLPIALESFEGGYREFISPKNPIQFIKASHYILLKQNMNWENFQELKFDVWNPQTKTLPLRIEIRDRFTQDYWTRVNRDFLVPPGPSSISISTRHYVGELSRPGRIVDYKNITHLFIDPQGQDLYFNNFRLEKDSTESLIFPELRAFDFGKPTSPVMSGFQSIDSKAFYTPQRGFGWGKKDSLVEFDERYPDPLYQDFIRVENGEWIVDLPNGDFHLIFNIDAPAGYWGEFPVFTERKVWANNKLILSESVQFLDFLSKYFRHAQSEDLPGDSVFNKYVEPSFQTREFDISVTKQKLILKFSGDPFGNGIALTNLVIFPKTKMKQGLAFWTEINKKRSAFFTQQFQEKKNAPRGLPPSQTYFRVFSHSYMKRIYPFDGPNLEEGDRELNFNETTSKVQLETLSVTPGDEYALAFSIQPRFNDSSLEKIFVTSTDLILNANGDPISSKNNPFNKQKKLPKTNSISSKYIEPGWIDYRFQRLKGAEFFYEVAPKYWHPQPAPLFPGITRTFWLRIRVPPDMVPGLYTGHIQLTLKVHRTHQKSVDLKIPYSIRVLPFGLDSITDLSIGPFGNSIELPAHPSTSESGTPTSTFFTKYRNWNYALLKSSLNFIKNSGCTTLSGLPHLNFAAKNGVINLDTKVADSEMKLLKSKGFNRIISSYGINLSYSMKGGADGADSGFAQQVGFSTPDKFLRALYKKIDEHAQKENWLPIAWNIVDEPLRDEISPAVKNVELHKAAFKGLHYNLLMGETSFGSATESSEFESLLKILPIVALNKHSQRAIEIIHKEGNQFAYYNVGNRWNFGRYSKSLVNEQKLFFRLGWHFNNNLGNPYFGLDSREDDYGWVNSNERMELIPSLFYLQQIQPGLLDYRYILTLENILMKHGGLEDKAKKAKTLLRDFLDLAPGLDEPTEKQFHQYEEARDQLIQQILILLP